MINQMASKYHINKWTIYDKPNGLQIPTGDSMINQMASKYHINNWTIYDTPNGLQIPY